MQHRVDVIGTARVPIVVIENFIADPATLVAEAARASFGVQSKFYPGIRAPAPASYGSDVCALLADCVRSVFGWRGDPEVLEANFSLVTVPAASLIPFQRVPHFDGVNPDELAVLHYLCRPGLGGTSFYRHRRTGYEVITPKSRDRYLHTVNAEVQSLGLPPAAYIDGDTALYERIARYEAVFNRALVYRGTSLHSGNIPVDFVPDSDPRTGRLTVNTFLRPSSPVPH